MEYKGMLTDGARELLLLLDELERDMQLRALAMLVKLLPTEESVPLFEAAVYLKKHYSDDEIAGIAMELAK
jgi:hypothetical protein